MQNQIIRATLAITALGALAACQKSACDYSEDSNRYTAASQMLTCFDSLPATTAAQMPTSGSAIYNGYFAGQINPVAAADDSLVGDSRLTANFTGVGGTVTGTVSNVTSANNGDLGSTLAVTGGTIIGNTVTGAGINGTLTGYGGATITINGTLAGGFLGEDAQGLLLATGVVTPAGTITSTAGMTGTIDISVFGTN